MAIEVGKTTGILPKHAFGGKNLPAAYNQFDRFVVQAPLKSSSPALSSSGDPPGPLPNPTGFIGITPPEPKAQALWGWTTTTYPNNYSWPTPSTFGTGFATKTGLQSQDLQNFLGVPTIIQGNPPVSMSNDQLMGLIRQAEDWVETTSGIMLTPTWIASPPIATASEVIATGVDTTSPQGQVLGIDYDYIDIGYDFIYISEVFNGRVGYSTDALETHHPNSTYSLYLSLT